MTYPVPGQPLRIESLRDSERGGVAARLSSVPADVRQLHREVLRAFLATGRSPHPDDLPLTAGIDRDAAFEQLADLDVVRLGADGHVLVAYPFSGEPTGHSVHLDDDGGGGAGPVLHAMCAIDALGIPLMTGLDGVIESTDPRRATGPHRMPRRRLAVGTRGHRGAARAEQRLRLGRGLPVPDGHLPRQPPARRGTPA